MSSYAEHHTLYQIANAPLREYPFPHLLVREVFDPGYYRSLLEHLLPAELMKPVKEVRAVGQKYSEDRFVFPLLPDETERLPPPYGAFWGELSAWLLGMPLLSALLRKFAVQMEQRFGPREPGVYNEAMLVDDRTRYSLGPHSDSPTKVITLLFYLPADDSRPHLGTSIYAPRDPSFRCPGGPHYPFELFERVTTMPYLPNTLFAFFKTDASFHGVEPIRDENCRRHLLFYDVRCSLEDLRQAQAAREAGAREAPAIEFRF
jgi:hypothetical protein